MNELVKPEDSEVFVEVSCFLNLGESSLACMADPEEIIVDEDHDPTKPQLEKVQRTIERNRQLREATSQESIRSYEDFKSEKHFSNPLNLRHYNKAPLTRLLRVGTGLCCHFQEKTRY